LPSRKVAPSNGKPLFWLAGATKIGAILGGSNYIAGKAKGMFAGLRRNYLMKITLRIIVDIILAIAIIQGWWFVALPLALFGVWYFQYFLEIIFAGLAYDSLFGCTACINIVDHLGFIIGCSISIGFYLIKNIVR